MTAATIFWRYDRRDHEVLVVVVTKHVRVVLVGPVTLVTTHIGAEVLSSTPLLVEAGVVVPVAIETGLGLVAHLGRQVGLKGDGRCGHQPKRKECQYEIHELFSSKNSSSSAKPRLPRVRREPGQVPNGGESNVETQRFFATSRARGQSRAGPRTSASSVDLVYSRSNSGAASMRITT